MAEDRRNGIGTTLLAFTLGAVIGGGLALLTAPRSGPETRKKLRGMVDETRDKLHEMTEETEDRIKKVVQEGRELLEQKADLNNAAVKAGKEAIEAEKAKSEAEA
jgi:gas vesicle protein